MNKYFQKYPPKYDPNESTYFKSSLERRQKFLVIIILCLFFTVPQFITAQTSLFNIGLGSSLSFEFANNTTNMVYPAPSINSTYYVKNKNYYFDLPIDLYVTIDLLYLEASIGFWFGGRTISTGWEETRITSGEITNFDYGVSKDGGYIGGYTWSIFLKMPAFGNKMWFPMFGIESRVLNWISPEKDIFTDTFVDNSKTWSNLWYKFGIGFDRPRAFTRKGFSRLELLLGFRGKNEYENELKNASDSSVGQIPVSLSLKFKVYFLNDFL
jgi:hypothetical protein